MKQYSEAAAPLRVPWWWYRCFYNVVRWLASNNGWKAPMRKLSELIRERAKLDQELEQFKHLLTIQLVGHRGIFGTLPGAGPADCRSSGGARVEPDQGESDSFRWPAHQDHRRRVAQSVRRSRGRCAFGGGHPTVAGGAEEWRWLPRAGADRAQPGRGVARRKQDLRRCNSIWRATLRRSLLPIRS